MRAQLVATALLLLANSTAAGSESSAKPLADRVVKLIEAGDAQGAADLLHYPATYTQGQRSTDSSNVARSIRFFIDRTGAASKAKPQFEPATFFEAGCGGGDGAYWQAIAPFKTVDYLYSVHFERIGDGFLKVRSVESPSIGKPALMSIGFGFPVADPRSKGLVVVLMLGLMEQRHGALPSGVAERIEQTLESFTFPGDTEAPQ